MSFNDDDDNDDSLLSLIALVVLANTNIITVTNTNLSSISYTNDYILDIIIISYIVDVDVDNTNNTKYYFNFLL